MPPTDGEAAGYLGTLLYLIFRKYPYQRLDGRIRGNMHQATIHRFCTYGTLMEEDNCEDDFCEEDINQILSRRTTVIQHESEKGSSHPSPKSHSPSQITNRSDIEIDHPDFWKKWSKKAEIDMEVGDRLRKKTVIVEEPRRRCQMRRYEVDSSGIAYKSKQTTVESTPGHDESVLDCSDLESSTSDSEKE
ncbi:hypothetical protein Pmani_015898 [Petrolisthes manimaculis]|uniref:Uncharacterized protein n=1 Tax=Petrolisthes manimaculis TaxID=1843537 RepID=A0AAE1PQ49_9EUCA|nr:hypothetical protein Pmani_015898 [Petrolisthes manimaculis]